MIARVPVCGTDAGEIADVWNFTRADWPSRGDIVREGDPAHSMYFVAAGKVEVALKKRDPCNSAPGHSRRGCRAARRPRTPTAVALTPTSLLALSAQDLHALMRRDTRIANRINDVVEKRVGHDVKPKDEDEDA